MPSDEVMHKWKTGQLHSGSKHGPIVKNQKQAIAIKLSEERAEKKGKLDRKGGRKRNRKAQRKR